MHNESQTEDLAQRLGHQWLVRVFNECESTMDEVRPLLADHDKIAVCAHAQSKGRGRRGNQWVSPLGGFYATYGVECCGPIERCEGLSLAVGVSIVEALSLTGSDIGLKWPNDIIHNPSRKKLGGILIELVASKTGHTALIGIGLNLDRVGAVLDSYSLAECGSTSSFSEIASTLADAAESAVRIATREGFSLYRDRWHSLAVHKGRSIVIQTGETGQEGAIVRGEYVGVDSAGALQIEVDGQLVSLHAGHMLEW